MAGPLPTWCSFFSLHHRRLAHLFLRLAIEGLALNASRERLAVRKLQRRACACCLTSCAAPPSSLPSACSSTLSPTTIWQPGAFAGVLQRIALCYLAASVLYLWTGVRTRWAIIAALLVGYWLLMRFVPVPGFGIPTVNIPLLDPDRNLVAWLDRKLMMGHLYERCAIPRAFSAPFPPSPIPSSASPPASGFARLRADPAKLLRRLVAAGLVCFARRRALGPHLPHQQKALDQLLRAPHRRPRHAGARRLLLAGGRKETAWPLDHHPLVFGTNCIFAYAFSEFAAIAAVTFKFHLDGNLVGP